MKLLNFLNQLVTKHSATEQSVAEQSVETLSYSKEKKEPSNFLKAVYPLINVSKDAMGNYKPVTLFDYALEQEKKAHIELAIDTAVAMTKLTNGYTVKPLKNGDFIAKRESVSAYVKVLSEAERLLNKEHSSITKNDIDELVAEKERYGCDAVILISLACLPLEEKFYGKVNDVFGLTGYDFIELLERSDQFSIQEAA